MGAFNPKPGQYWYEHFHKINGYVWRVWQKVEENRDVKVEDFTNKLDAVSFVHKMNGWSK